MMVDLLRWMVILCACRSASLPKTQTNDKLATINTQLSEYMMDVLRNGIGSVSNQLGIEFNHIHCVHAVCVCECVSVFMCVCPYGLLWVHGYLVEWCSQQLSLIPLSSLCCFCCCRRRYFRIIWHISDRPTKKRDVEWDLQIGLYQSVAG